MRSKHGSRAAWLAAFLILMGPLASLKAAVAAAKESPAKEPVKGESAAKPETAAKAETTEAKGEPKEGAKEEAKEAAGHKSPTVAGGLAFFPGVAVHGTGHMYAGSWVKGLGLLAIEGAALGIGISTATNGWNDIQKLMDGTKNGAIPTNVGTAYQTGGVVLVCTMAFLWSWFDDMAGAPIAAGEYNKLMDEAAGQAHLRLLPEADGAKLALVSHF